MDNNPPITEILHKSDMLKGLTDEQCAKVAQGGQNEKLHPKRTLFLQGDPAQKCYMVNRGRLKLAKLNELGKEVIIRYIGVGEMTAAVAVLKDLDYPVTAEAVAETEVTGWDKPTFLRLIHDYPEIAINMLGVVLERLDDVQHRYLELCTETVEQRIARTLLRLMRRAGSRTRDGILIEIPLSRQSIADYSGTTLYTVSRTLSAWEKIGWFNPGGNGSPSPTRMRWWCLPKTGNQHLFGNSPVLTRFSYHINFSKKVSCLRWRKDTSRKQGYPGFQHGPVYPVNADGYRPGKTIAIVDGQGSAGPLPSGPARIHGTAAFLRRLSHGSLSHFGGCGQGARPRHRTTAPAYPSGHR
jgi:CRP-like cAMP-binding protein